MKTFKNFLLGLLVIASMSGCGLLWKRERPQPNEGIYGATAMRILYDKDFTRVQFDSICVADTIPPDLKLWKSYSVRDYETGKPITEYMYIKRLGVSEELFRLMVKTENNYNIYKRVTYGIKEE